MGHRTLLLSFAALALAIGLCGCATTGTQASGSMARRPFGVHEGRDVMIWSITNANGVRADITPYGGILVRLLVPDRDGKLRDVVLGYDRLDDYVRRNPFFGCIVGRYANRIADARFELDGRTVRVERNQRPNHCHGGRRGFDKVVWDAEPVALADGAGLKLTHHSPDGHAGFPGAVEIEVTYTLTSRNTLRVDYRATTTAPTVLNLTQHSYFNLNGNGNGTILGHDLEIPADTITEARAGLIPTGKLLPVGGTPFDFRRGTPIGQGIDEPHLQLLLGKGYDHNWVLNRSGPGLARAARLYAPESGIELQVWTTEPGLQIYAGNYLDGSIDGKDGTYGRHGGICLETQHFPDSPNHPHFPSTVLRPGDTFRSTTEFRFSRR